MMTIREYFADEEMWEEEAELYTAMEEDWDFDLEGWAEEHGVDLEAIDERTGETVLTLWCWDMCGD
jgi:hypothetical protein